MIIYRAETYQEEYDFHDHELKEIIDVLGYFFTKEAAQNEIIIDIETYKLLKLTGRIIEIQVKK